MVIRALMRLSRTVIVVADQGVGTAMRRASTTWALVMFSAAASKLSWIRWARTRWARPFTSSGMTYWRPRIIAIARTAVVNAIAARGLAPYSMNEAKRPRYLPVLRVAWTSSTRYRVIAGSM